MASDGDFCSFAWLRWKQARIANVVHLFTKVNWDKPGYQDRQVSLTSNVGKLLARIQRGRISVHVERQSD